MGFVGVAVGVTGVGGVGGLRVGKSGCSVGVLGVGGVGMGFAVPKSPYKNKIIYQYWNTTFGSHPSIPG